VGMRSGGVAMLGALVVTVVAACSSSHHLIRQAQSPAAPAVAPAMASPGCRNALTPRVTNQDDALDVSGTSRSYLLTTPSPHRLPEPLVMDIHGYGEGATTESLTTRFGELGQRDGFVVVFPNGTGTPIAWDTSTRPGNPDVHYLAALIRHLEATQCLDESRVYATGLSQGAFMTSTLACVMSGTFAAVAPVAGVQLPHPCPITRPVPLLAFHGTADPILHFNGGVGRRVLADDLRAHPRPLPALPPARLNGPGYPAAVRAWALADGCRPTPNDVRLSPHVIRRSYSCPADVAVQFDIIIGGGHSWPGSAVSAAISPFVGHTTMEINATAAIWAFLDRYRLS
jgi:polyhydroxybutyrate depolymerase